MSDLYVILLAILLSLGLILVSVIYTVLNFAKIKYPPVKEGDITYEEDDVDTSKIVSGYISREEGV